jgi:hypothetical protein
MANPYRVGIELAMASLGFALPGLPGTAAAALVLSGLGLRKKEPWGAGGSADRAPTSRPHSFACATEPEGGDQGLGCGVLQSLSSAEPWPGMRHCVAPPRPGPYLPPYQSGGHCGGDGSVLRFRALIAMTNWRGLRQPHALL